MLFNLKIILGICQFGLAHVDTPKGDLDASSGKLYSPEANYQNSIGGSINGNNNDRIAKPIIVGDARYPKGTYEMFPNIVDSQNNIILNSAHDYMECSNKGICDRSSGLCACFPEYDGSACQEHLVLAQAPACVTAVGSVLPSNCLLEVIITTLMRYGMKTLLWGVFVIQDSKVPTARKLCVNMEQILYTTTI